MGRGRGPGDSDNKRDIFSRFTSADQTQENSRTLDDQQMGAMEDAVPSSPSAEATLNAYVAQRTSEHFEDQTYTGDQAQDMQTATLSQGAQEQIDQMPDEAKAEAVAAGQQILSVFDKYAEQSAEADQSQEVEQAQETEQEPERDDDR